jgi:alpha-mannosidase
VETISLAAGDAGNRVEFANKIDWRSKAVNLKVAFPLTASNPNATYNEEVGTIERPNATDRQFETFSHRWIDLTDKSGNFGATILTEAKNASDKPTDNTIRLTLLRTPGLQPPANGGRDRTRTRRIRTGDTTSSRSGSLATVRDGVRRRRIGTGIA